MRDVKKKTGTDKEKSSSGGGDPEPPKDPKKDPKKKDESKEKQEDPESDPEDSDLEDSDEEDVDGEKKGKGRKTKKPNVDNRSTIMKTFFHKNGDPKYENFAMIGVSALLIAYLSTLERPAKELTYVEFINEYLLKNNVKMVTITKDKGQESFHYKALVETLDGQTYYITLASVDNFLAKLDLTQREMGKSPNDFIPVKYASNSGGNGDMMFLYLLLFGAGAALAYKLYKG